MTKVIKKEVKPQIETIKKEKITKVKVPKIELISYTIRATIPTGAYANVCPEITVKAKSLEEAEAYVIPHINKLFEDFLNKSERRTVVPKVEVKETPAPTPQGAAVKPPTAESVQVPAKVEPTKITVDGKPTGMTVPEKVEVKTPLDPQKTNEDIAHFQAEKNKAEQPLHSVPYVKAKAAVDSCMSIEALEVIKNQVTKSTKLSDNEKNALLMVVIVAKEKTLEL